MKRAIVAVVCVLLLASASASAQFKFKSFGDPSATATFTRGVNNHGVVVGGSVVNGVRHAIKIENGVYVPLAPNTVLGTSFSEAFKINDRGNVVGTWIDNDTGLTSGFLLRQGALTTLAYPGATDTYAYGINNFDVVCGYYDILDDMGNLVAYHGFLWFNGKFYQFDFPGAVDTDLTGINDLGMIVGSWDSGVESPTANPFLYAFGKFTNLLSPNGQYWQPNDINLFGQIVGEYMDADGNYHGYLQNGSKFTVFDYPGATLTTAWSINDRGQITGRYVDGVGGKYGFLASK